LELAWNGDRPITLDTGEQRSFIEDGDNPTLAGWCEADGYRVEFGQCSDVVLPALELAQRTKRLLAPLTCPTGRRRRTSDNP
jgi:fumarylacetoacetase